MAKLNPYLIFNGTCREAMTFYKGCFGGELNMTTVGETPPGKDMPADKKNKIMHARLQAGDVLIMAADEMGPVGSTPGGNISLSVTASSKKEIDTLFEKLSGGGKILHAPKQEFFGYYGDLKDKYGTTWMLVHETPRP